MSTNLVIVAIPEEQDRVWKVSSEQVPHLTLLFLGDVGQVQHVDQIVQFVEHAVTTSEHGQFYLDIERRGELGPDNADVVFFSKRSWNLKWIQQFRGQLLKNDAIKTAYDSTQQYDEWSPHLTLGYPAAPANDESGNGFDHPLFSVCFDRIAVWTQDFAGPEFQLEWPDRELEGDLAVAYSNMAKAGVHHYAMNGATLAPDPTERGAEFIEHFGVKGMRWGLRRRSSPAAEAFVRTGSTKQDHKDSIVDAKWLKADVRNNGLSMSKTDKKIFDSANKSLKSEAKAINKKPEYSGRQAKKELKRGDTPLRQQYDKEHQALFVKHLRQAAEKHLDPANKDVVSPSGKWEKDLRVFRDGSWMVGVRRTKGDGGVSGAGSGTSAFGHSAQDAAKAIEIVVQVRPIRDEEGLITNYELVDNSTDLAQTTVNAVHDTLNTGEAFVDGLVHSAPETLGEQFIIEHFGVKGMRWGVRKAEPIKSKSGHTIFRGKAKVDVEGGGGHPAHPDAIKVAEAKTKLKKSGAAALSNEELRTVANRLQLEGQVHQLIKTKGKKFVDRHLEEQSNQLVRTGLREGAKRALKRGAKVAAVAAI